MRLSEPSQQSGHLNVVKFVFRRIGGHPGLNSLIHIVDQAVRIGLVG